MSFGLPCPDDIDPSAVYSGTQAVTDVVTSLVTAIEGEIQSAYQQAVGYTGQSVGVLQKTLQNQIAAVQRTFRAVLDALASALTSGIVGGNVQFGSALQYIAQTLQTTTEDVLYGTPHQAAPPPPFQPGYPVTAGPVPLSPGTGAVPVAGTATGAPGTGAGLPARPAGAAPGEPLPGQPGLPPAVPAATVTIWRDGAPSSLTQICAPVQSDRPVLVAGRVYQPRASVYANGTGPTIGANGQPSFPVGYDSQPDGSVVVYAGPISVRLSLDPHPSDPTAPVCELG